MNLLLCGDKPKKKRSKTKDGLSGNWKWSQIEQESFDDLKGALTSPPVLGFTDSSLPFEMSIDASSSGLGSVLYQTQNGETKVIAYASRGLSKTERNYPAHKLEFLALKWSVVDKFYDYIGTNKCIVYTDNNPLTYVLSSAKLDCTSHRWLSDLASFNLELKYKTGKTNIDADCLSRLPQSHSMSHIVQNTPDYPFSINQDCFQAIASQNSPNLIETLTMSNQVTNLENPKEYEFSGFDRIKWRVAQREDKVIGPFLRYVTYNQKPKHTEILQDFESKTLFKQYDHLVVKRGLLFRKVLIDETDKFQLILPKKYREMALVGLHDDMGHLGRDKTLSLVRDRFYWPRMTTDVEEKIKTCDRCLKRKTPSNSKSPLISIKTYQPLELVCMDYLTLESSKGGYQNILVITDHFTKYAVAIATKNQSAKTTAEAFFQNFVVHYGFPHRIHSDQGPCFESDLMTELCKISGMNKSRTTPYHPIGKGVCERFNRTLLGMLGTMDPDHKQDWKSHLNALVHAYNCTKHESTQVSPFFLMFGRHPRLPIDIILGIEPNENYPNQSVYIDQLKKRLKQAYEVAASQMDKAQIQQKKNYDKKDRGAIVQVGDRVLVKIVKFEGKHKISDRWENTPYTVIDQPNKDIPVYIVQKEGDCDFKRTLHRNLLLPISSNPIPILRKSKLSQVQNKTDSPRDTDKESINLTNSPVSDSSDSDEEFIVESSKSSEPVSENDKRDDVFDETKSQAAPKIREKINPPPQPVLRRSLRKCRLPERFRSGDYVMGIQPSSTFRQDWVDRANYIKKLALEDSFSQMPTFVSQTLLEIIQGK